MRQDCPETVGSRQLNRRRVRRGSAFVPSRRSLGLALCVALLALPSLAVAKKRAKKERGIQWDLQTDADASTGVIKNTKTLHRNALFVEAGLEMVPEVKFNRQFTLSIPLDARYRHTWITPLREIGAGVVPSLSYQPIRAWEFELNAGIDGVYRPGWLDQYQPQPDGSLGTTDRYSYYTRAVGGSARWGSFKKLRLKLAYEFSVIDYIDDPTYNPNEEPTHLVPGDRLEHTVKLDAHRRWGILSVKPGFDVTRKHYFNAYARDARTGLTHAGAGGVPANPVLQVWDLEPAVRVEVVAIRDQLTLTAGYAHGINIDIHQGYYSYQAPRPSLDIEYQPTEHWSFDLGGDIELRRYGRASYAEGGSHPPLEEGSRRRERAIKLALQAAYALNKHWSAFVGGEWFRKDSNMPDYVPGVYPASQQYSIDWDYTNTTATAGVRFEI